MTVLSQFLPKVGTLSRAKAGCHKFTAFFRTVITMGGLHASTLKGLCAAKY